MKKQIFVSFHIGHGGHLNNPGHLTFHGEEDFQDLIKRCSDVSMIINEDEDGNTLPDSQWVIEDTGGNVILQGRQEIEAMTGRLEWDTIYDTDYVTTADDLTAEEVDAIFEAYKNEEYMSDELKDFICSEKELKRVHSIKRYPANFEVGTQYGVETIDIDGQAGEFTRQEWKSDLEDRGFDTVSVEKILDKMEISCNEDFFKED